MSMKNFLKGNLPAIVTMSLSIILALSAAIVMICSPPKSLEILAGALAGTSVSLLAGYMSAYLINEKKFDIYVTEAAQAELREQEYYRADPKITIEMDNDKVTFTSVALLKLTNNQTKGTLQKSFSANTHSNLTVDGPVNYTIGGNSAAGEGQVTIRDNAEEKTVVVFRLKKHKPDKEGYYTFGDEHRWSSIATECSLKVSLEENCSFECYALQGSATRLIPLALGQEENRLSSVFSQQGYRWKIKIKKQDADRQFFQST